MFITSLLFMASMAGCHSPFSIWFPRIIEGPPPKVPLRNMHIDVMAVDGTAQANYTLSYYNDLADTLTEAKLILPFDTDTAVSDVILHIGNRTLFSKAFENTLAKEIYEEKKEENKTVLLVRRQYDSLSIDLAAIPPHSEIDVSFTAFSTLPNLFDHKSEEIFSRFVLPLTFIPRYSPQDSTSTSSNPQISANPPYSFGISFSSPKAKKIISSSASKSPFVISTAPSSDLVVDIYEGSSKSVTVSTFNSTQLTTFSFSGLDIPHSTSQPLSIVFIVDRSGSMNGEPIMRVREAMSTFIHSLPSDCRFDIVGFGSSYSSLFSGLRKYDDASLSIASKYINRLEADMGGTEILRPLQSILPTMKPDVCFLLTDGAVSNTESVLSYISDFRTRFHTLGIGGAASVDLVRGIASKSGGTYEFVNDISQIEGSVIRLLTDATSPALINVTIESDGCGVPMQRNPTILPKSSLTRFSFLTEKEGNCSVRISGNLLDGSVFSAPMNTYEVKRQTSKSLISAAIVKAINDGVLSKETEISLAISLNILTKVTSLLLYDEVGQNNFSAKQSFDVPIFGQKNYGDAINFHGGHVFGARMMKAKSRMAPNLALNMESDHIETTTVRDDSSALACRKIVGLQSADGRWVMSEELKSILGTVNNDSGFTDQDAYTALALEYVSKKCGASYGLVADKARKYLQSKLSTEQCAKLIGWAAKRLN